MCMRPKSPAEPGAPLGPRRFLPVLLSGVALSALAACQAPPAPGQGELKPLASAESPGPDRPTIVPGCQADRKAQLTNGLEVAFAGEDPKDRGTCLLSWKGRTYRFVLGVLPKGKGQRSSAREREALRTALRGPVGTKAEFEDKDAALWKRVTVEHVADPVVQLEDGPRRVAQLRIIRHDAHDRPHVRQVSLHYVDLRTGIVLKRQVVTEMDDGEELVTEVWRVERLG
jgi:hypothetical protein